MVFGIDDALLAAGLGAAGSIGSGWLAGRSQGNKETKMQKTRRKLVDELLASLNGNGAYSDLFNSDQETFQKSFVEPAQSLFRNQIAPQIQQQYISSGQQRGTGLDDQLLRAGVDLDSMLNQYMYQHQQDALNRKQNAISGILGTETGAAPQSSSGQDFASAFSGYLSGPGFADSYKDYFKNSQQPTRKGYADDWSNQQPGVSTRSF